MTNQQKEQTPTFVVVLPLVTDDQTKWQLGLATEVARLIYNATAGFGHKQLRLLRESKEWLQAIKIKDKAERSKRCSELRKAYGLTKNSFRQFANNCCKDMDRRELGDHAAQWVGEQVWLAFERYIFKKSGKPRFKSRNRGINIIAGTCSSDVVFDLAGADALALKESTNKSYGQIQAAFEMIEGKRGGPNAAELPYYLMKKAEAKAKKALDNALRDVADGVQAAKAAVEKSSNSKKTDDNDKDESVHAELESDAVQLGPTFAPAQVAIKKVFSAAEAVNNAAIAANDAVAKVGLDTDSNQSVITFFMAQDAMDKLVLASGEAKTAIAELKEALAQIRVKPDSANKKSAVEAVEALVKARKAASKAKNVMANAHKSVNHAQTLFNRLVLARADAEDAFLNNQGAIDPLKHKKIWHKIKRSYRCLPQQTKAARPIVRWRGLRMEVLYEDDLWHHMALCKDPAGKLTKDNLKRIKFCRLVRHHLNGKERWFVHIYLEGKPPVLHSIADKSVRMGVDPTLNGFAYYISEDNDGKTEAGKILVSPRVMQYLDKICLLDHQIERSRRVNNPDNYDAKGKVKKGPLQWKKSKRYDALCAKRKELYRKLAATRKSDHGKVINEFLGKSGTVMCEKNNHRAFQRSFGRVINRSAIGSFIAHFKRSAERAGLDFIELDPFSLKLSQYDPATDTYTKKPLSQRWHQWGNTDKWVDRDIMSAFLACYVTEQGHDRRLLLDKWPAAEALLCASGYCRQQKPCDAPHRSSAMVSP
ncbi:MAG: hypothetical protein ROM54_06760 [Anaerobiospirillum sp.]|nr:hypothetical protein [Anaerobiospirillum sp.]